MDMVIWIVTVMMVLEIVGKNIMRMNGWWVEMGIGYELRMYSGCGCKFASGGGYKLII